MAKLYDVAKDLKDVAEEGIGWLLVWREGHGWKGTAVWPDELAVVEKVVEDDEDAILVNSYVHNLGVDDYKVGCARLEDSLRYHYKHKTALAADYIT